MRIIPRRIELRAISNAGTWIMLYGRRKTGKTFLVEHFLDYDEFFFVNRDGTVYDRLNDDYMTHSEFLRIFPRLLGRGRIIVDEFHRLPERFLDLLHANAGRGDLVLITSTLWLAERLLQKKSPLLGIVTPVRIDLIDEREILLELAKELEGRELIEAATYLREPLLIQPYKKPLRNFLTSFLKNSGLMVRELVGETFSEEERELTEVYETILRGISDGKTTSTELSSLLYSRGLISKDNPGVLQKYLLILTDMGILERREVHGKKRKKFAYRHHSPLLDLHFYLEAKYAYTELETPEEFIRKAIDKKLPKHVESFIEGVLMRVYGLRPIRMELPNTELDIMMKGFRKLELVGEVKWKNHVKREEVRKIEDKLSMFSCKKVLVVPSEDVLERKPENIEILTPEMLIRLAEKSLTSH